MFAGTVRKGIVLHEMSLYFLGILAFLDLVHDVTNGVKMVEGTIHVGFKKRRHLLSPPPSGLTETAHL
jgi:hypothetical protein